MAENADDIKEFEKSRAQLINVSTQKRNFVVQSEILNNAIEELEKTKEKIAYKAIGNILIPADPKELVKELKSQKENIDLRIKTFQKQEDALLEKLNKLKAKIEKSEVENISAESENSELASS
ncbi:MAG: prefoldin subunit [Candidatus Diapherotrites archaeon]|nr:prefoldin subunit [Candidatus Diapherotrites archaeon]